MLGEGGSSLEATSSAGLDSAGSMTESKRVGPHRSILGLDRPLSALSLSTRLKMNVRRGGSA